MAADIRHYFNGQPFNQALILSQTVASQADVEEDEAEEEPQDEDGGMLDVMMDEEFEEGGDEDDSSLTSLSDDEESGSVGEELEQVEEDVEEDDVPPGATQATNFQDLDDVDIVGNKYAEALKEDPRTLAKVIFDEEKAAKTASVKDLDLEAFTKIVIKILFSVPGDVLLEMIVGNLALAKRVNDAKGRRLKATLEYYLTEKRVFKDEKEWFQPCIYHQLLVDRKGQSPTANELDQLVDDLRDYVKDMQFADIIDNIPMGDDRAKKKAVVRKGGRLWEQKYYDLKLKKFTIDWKTRTHNVSNAPKQIQELADALERRLSTVTDKTQPLKKPLNEEGFAYNAKERLRQHRNHQSSNRLMNLSETILEYRFPGRCQIDQNVVFRCFSLEQGGIGEILLTRLCQGYVSQGGGFSHFQAGISTPGAYNQLINWRACMGDAVKKTPLLANYRLQTEIHRKARAEYREEVVKRDKEQAYDMLTTVLPHMNNKQDGQPRTRKQGEAQKWVRNLAELKLAVANTSLCQEFGRLMREMVGKAPLEELEENKGLIERVEKLTAGLEIRGPYQRTIQGCNDMLRTWRATQQNGEEDVEGDLRLGGLSLGGEGG